MPRQGENQRNSTKNFSIDALLKVNHDTTDTRVEAEMNFNANFQSQVKSHRRRSTFSALQVHVLETEFYKHRYVSPEKRAGLAAFLGLSQQQIKIWFQNRRYKTKVKHDSGKRFDSTTIRHQSNSQQNNQQLHPIVNVPLQSTTPIYPVWLLQRRATLLNALARQVRQPALFQLSSTITQMSSDQKSQ